MSLTRVKGRRSGARLISSKAFACCAAVVAVLSFAGLAVAASSTLATGKATVKGKSETVVVDSRGATLYTLSGETAHHLECTSTMCLKFWPPYKVSANTKLSKAKGVKGTVSKLRRGSFYQVMLNGHPLYRFLSDGGKNGSALGEGVTAFGGTWHVIHRAASPSPILCERSTPAKPLRTVRTRHRC
jgi:predicted lipoprotein with Yx(FWY)xxD motif